MFRHFATAAIIATASISAPAFAQISAGGAEVVDNGTKSTMKFTPVQTRVKARAMGFGGAAQYAVLPGPQAMLRVSSDASFIVALPSNMQPNGAATLASFETRKNNTREVLIGGGFNSFSTGIHPDRIIAVNFTEAASQEGAPEGNTLYEIKPSAPLAAGEYALVLQTGQMSAGSQIGGSFFDFGVN